MGTVVVMHIHLLVHGSIHILNMIVVVVELHVYEVWRIPFDMPHVFFDFTGVLQRFLGDASTLFKPVLVV